MASGPATGAGATLSIGTTAASAATDTYTAIGEVISIPAFGRKYDVIKYNALGNRATKKFKGKYDDGDLAVPLGKDMSDAGQAALAAALNVDADYNFKVVANDAVVAASSAVTVTVAAPGIFTWTAHGLPAGTAVKFSTTGALPTGITAGTTYYVAGDANLTVNAFAVSATLAAALAGTGAITTTGTQSGTHTGTTIPAGTTQTFKAKVTGYETGPYDSGDVIKAMATLDLTSGSIVEQVHLP